MIYLFLQSVFGSLFGLCIKWVGNRNLLQPAENMIVVGAINYIVAAISITPWFFSSEVEPASGAILTGGAMGLVYFIAFFFVIQTIRWIGVSATTVVGVMAILLPIAVAALFWNQIPTKLQIIGIALALIALILIGWKNNAPSGPPKPWFVPLVMVAFFFLSGLSRVCQEAFNYLSVPADISFGNELEQANYLGAQQPTFLLSAFVVTAIPSACLLGYRWIALGKKIQKTEFAFGVALGLTNILQCQLALQCLAYFPGYIVFPVTSAGAILVTTLVAVSWLGERLSLRGYAGIAVAMVALFLLQ